MRTLVVVAALAALALAGAAAARRAPTAAEAAALRSAFAGYVRMPHSPAAKDNRIVAISVSTLDPRYAALRLDSPSVGRAEMVLHRSFGTWWPVGFGSSLGCAAGPQAVLSDLRIGCSPPAAAAWINDCGPLVSAPRELVIACGDGNYALEGLRWRGWGSARATATGTARANDCTPSCAAGRFHSFRMTATADRLTRCGGARYYARVTIVYAGARPAGAARRDVVSLVC